MKNVISKNLSDLIKLIDKPIYIVGGAVRDFLLGVKIQDIDLAGKLMPEELAKKLEGSKFKVDKASQRLGTVRIIAKGEAFEYTTFRKDSYDLSGKHTPIEVGFVDDIKVDAKRRDFTINSIYYDFYADEFLDYNGGIEDLRNKIIRTPLSPKQTFKEDALRILRAIRLASEINFKVEVNTYHAAKESLPGLKNISYERIQEEFNKIILSDTRNNIEYAHHKGFLGLYQLGALEHIFPEILPCIEVKQHPKYHKFDVFNHIVEVFKYSKPNLIQRLSALLHDLGKAEYKGSYFMQGHAEASIKYAKEFLQRMKYSRSITSSVLKVVETHMFNPYSKQRFELIHFIQDNYRYIDEIIDFQKADKMGKVDSKKTYNCPLEETKAFMIENNVPFGIKDLPVGGQDLIDASIQESQRSNVLRALLKETALDFSLTSKDKALAFIKSHMSSKK